MGTLIRDTERKFEPIKFERINPDCKDFINQKGNLKVDKQQFSLRILIPCKRWLFCKNWSPASCVRILKKKV